MTYSKLLATPERVSDLKASYSIGIVYGLGFKDGKPEIHALNKLEKLKELIDFGEVERGIITSGPGVGSVSEYFITEMRAPREKIYTDVGRSFIDHMYHIERMVDRWIRKGEIPSSVLLHHIVQTWAVERAEFDASWIIRKYPSEVIGVEDGRPEEVIREVDTDDEPRRMKVDQLASKIPLLEYYPPAAQYIAYLRYPPRSVRRLIGHGKRFLPI